MSADMGCSAELQKRHYEQKKGIASVTSKLERGVEHLLIGQSGVMCELRNVIRTVAPRKLPVLIQGQTGSGKELVAQAIHLESRRIGRFVALNVAALPDGLFEAELFGHVRGAFSGAVKDRTGLLRSAAQGTVFLDEIGELSLFMQAKLLRVLETHEVWPMGVDRGAHVDMRIVTATNADLAALVRQGKFRADLWYRLCGVTIHVPALRERTDDIPILVQHFATRIAAEHAEIPVTLEKSALQALQQYPWPGNVRELRDVVGRLAMEGTSVITEAQVRNVVLRADTSIDVCRTVSSEMCVALQEAREELELLLRLHGDDVHRVAAVLQVAPSTVYRRMRKYGMRVGPRGPKIRR